MRQVDLTGRQRQCGVDAECRISSEEGPLGRSPSGTGDACSQRAVPYSAEALCSVLTRHVSWLSVSKGLPDMGRSLPALTAAFPVLVLHQWLDLAGIAHRLQWRYRSGFSPLSRRLRSRDAGQGSQRLPTEVDIPRLLGCLCE